MEQWIIASIIIGSLLVLLMTGLPIAFALSGLSALFLLILLGPSAMLMAVAACFKQISEEVFIAIPLFVFMATILQFSGIATHLYNAMYVWMGSVRGGLAAGTLMICTVIDAMSGIGATATTTMGLIALPEMVNKGYNKNICMGAIAAGGALGPLIPPSVLMIIVGGYAQLSVGKLFLGGVMPGLLITAVYSAYVLVRCYLRPQDGPALPRDKQISLRSKLAALKSVILPIALIVFIMGGIYAGIFTPTEAAGFGALSALLIAAAYRKLSGSDLVGALQTSLRITCMIMWLVIGGGCYSTLVNVTGTGNLVLQVLQDLPFSSTTLTVIMLIIPLIMGMFIDPIAITMICVPIFIPVINSIGIDLLWFMLLFIIAVVIGYITPPFGINIFYMQGVAPQGTSVMDVYKGITPFAFAKIGCLILCIVFPQILIWLPNLMD